MGPKVALPVDGVAAEVLVGVVVRVPTFAYNVVFLASRPCLGRDGGVG